GLQSFSFLQSFRRRKIGARIAGRAAPLYQAMLPPEKNPGISRQNKPLGYSGPLAFDRTSSVAVWILSVAGLSVLSHLSLGGARSRMVASEPSGGPHACAAHRRRSEMGHNSP